MYSPEVDTMMHSGLFSPHRHNQGMLVRLLLILVLLLLLTLCYQQYTNNNNERMLRRDISISAQRTKQVEKELDAIQKGLQLDLGREKSENEKLKSQLSQLKSSLQSQQESQRVKDLNLQQYYQEVQHCENEKSRIQESCVESSDKINVKLNDCMGDNMRLEKDNEQVKLQLSNYLNNERKSLYAQIESLQQQQSQQVRNPPVNNNNNAGGFPQHVDGSNQNYPVNNNNNYNNNNENRAPDLSDQARQQNGQQLFNVGGAPANNPQNFGRLPGFNGAGFDRVKESNIVNEQQYNNNNYDNNIQMVPNQQGSNNNNVQDSNQAIKHEEHGTGNEEDGAVHPVRWRSQQSNLADTEESENNGGEKAQHNGPLVQDALIQDHQADFGQQQQHQQEEAVAPVLQPMQNVENDEGNAAEKDMIGGDGAGAIMPPMDDKSRQEMEKRAMEAKKENMNMGERDNDQDRSNHNNGGEVDYNSEEHFDDGGRRGGEKNEREANGGIEMEGAPVIGGLEKQELVAAEGGVVKEPDFNEEGEDGEGEEGGLRQEQDALRGQEGEEEDGEETHEDSLNNDFNDIGNNEAKQQQQEQVDFEQ